MAKARPRHFPPPLKGLEWRDVFQDTEAEAITADCMLNVETSYGELRERDGFVYVRACASHAQIYATDQPNRGKRLITVGHLTTSGQKHISVSVADLGTGEPAITSLTGLTGEFWYDGFRCSFVPVRLPGGPELAFDATLIVTPKHTYCVLPDGSVRAANMTDATSGGDCLRDNDKNFSYIKTRPKGPIAVSHADKVFYMGWGADTKFEFTSVIEDEQVLIPGVLLDPERGSYRLGSDWLMFSDEFSSLDIQAHHCLRTNDREEITGAASFRDVLVVFTDVSMYVLLGSSALDFQLRKVDGGVGCVSHGSIVEADGLLYWMARDGVYAFDGSKVQKVSVGIDQFWSKDPRTGFVPSEFSESAKSMGWPFRASRHGLNLVNSVHLRERSLILWSVPSSDRANTFFRGSNSLPVTLVHDYKHGGFYFWCMPDFTHLSQSIAGTCMYDGVSVVDRGKETLYTTGFIGSVGGIRRYGEYIDMPASSVDQGIPFVWMTGRIDKNVIGTARIQSTRFSVRARGESHASSDSDYSDVSWSVFDATTKHQTDLEDSYNRLPMYPPELLSDETMTGTASPLLGTGAMGSMKLSSVDYFKSKGGGCRSADGSLRVALFSNGGDFDPGLRMNAWAFEIDRGDTR